MTFFYKFPRIDHIQQVLPSIEGYEGFAVNAKEGGYTAITYHVSIPGMFVDVQNEGDAIRRECRGLLFNSKSGELISRPYHKFKNINESDETQAHNIPLGEQHILLEKLDGSMIRPFILPDTGQIRFATKAGITDVSLQAEEWYNSLLYSEQSKMAKYHDFMKKCLAMNCTPLFEWCSRKQKIVVDHPIDKLILTGVRWNISGEYWRYLDLKLDAPGIDLVEDISASIMFEKSEDVDFLVKNISAWEDGAEGIVVRWNNGHMAKLKSEWYCTLHKTKESLMRERHLIQLILDDKLDDILGILDDSDRRNIEEFTKLFWTGLEQVTANIENFWYNVIVRDNISRKDCALTWTKEIGVSLPIIFQKYSGFDIRESLIKKLRNGLGSNKALSELRWIFNDIPEWKGLGINEEVS